jgi:hypothetical protein
MSAVHAEMRSQFAIAAAQSPAREGVFAPLSEHPGNPWFETHPFPKSFAATLAALPSMSLVPVAPFSEPFNDSTV